MRSPAFPPRRASHLVRYIFPAVVLLCLFYYLTHTSPEYPAPYPSSKGSPAHHGATSPGHKSDSRPKPVDVKPVRPVRPDHAEKPIYDKPAGKPSKPSRPTAVAQATGTHPIDSLIRGADEDFDELLAKESKTLNDAAEAYRKRRGRHPPPGFKAWYQFATENNAIIVEDFFDQIYHDLSPFWGVEPELMRKEAWDFEMTINIRNGNATAASDWFWTKIWLNMTKTIEHLLPDMDIALNAMDEPRLVVPWEDIKVYMDKEKKTRQLTPARDVISQFDSLPSVQEGYKTPATRDYDWEKTKQYWLIARRGCPPDSLARTTKTMASFDRIPNIDPSLATRHQRYGFVANYTLSTDFCHQPDLQGLEGIFIEPLSTSATKTLFPMFGGSKLAVNNEILLPAPMYWNGEERFVGNGDIGLPWNDKLGNLVWRGVATGGQNRATNWRGFQRHRFVAMNNATKLRRAQEWGEIPPNFALPPVSYGLKAQKDAKLGQWVSQWADVGFTDLMCDPETEPEPLHCAYTGQDFDILQGKPLDEMFDYKYLPDIDGNSFSGRYLGFLRSTSLPLKSTLWREWHDSRLVAWKHFVPMDNRFEDYYSIMEYFVGYGSKAPAHDAMGEKIATAGKEWAEKVLRKEDMQIYVLRLLLEYARVSDPRREKMGWVDDLTA